MFPNSAQSQRARPFASEEYALPGGLTCDSECQRPNHQLGRTPPNAREKHLNGDGLSIACLSVQSRLSCCPSECPSFRFLQRR